MTQQLVSVPSKHLNTIQLQLEAQPDLL